MTMQPCMTDNYGRAVSEWLPQMQSTPFLRAAIARGERTAECWSEISRRHERVRSAEELIASLDWSGENIAPELLA